MEVRNPLDRSNLLPSPPLKLPSSLKFSTLSFLQILQTRAAFVSGQEVLEHLEALKPELDTIKSAYEDRRMRFRRMKDEEIKLEPEERELTWGGRDQQEGLWAVVDEVSDHHLLYQL